MEFADKELFLKYALPCGQVLVKRGTISQEEYSKGFDISPAVFKVGLAQCEQTAKKLGKNIIDKEVIHQYFWYDHSKVIEERSKIYKDIDAKMCTIYPGRYLGNNIVELPIGKRKVKIDYTLNIREGDYVTVHYDYTCEILSKEEFEELWRMRK